MADMRDILFLLKGRIHHQAIKPCRRLLREWKRQKITGEHVIPFELEDFH